MTDFDDADIIDGRKPGGSTISQSILIASLADLLAAAEIRAPLERYSQLAVEQNVLGKSSIEGRRRAFRVLRELYILSPTRILFRALRDLWDQDPASRPLLAGLCAYARDSSFRASGAAVLPIRPNQLVMPAQLADAVRSAHPGSYSEATAAKIARNTGASWSQTGHLTAGTGKTRRRVVPTPAAGAYALLLAHLQGLRGQSLLSSQWAQFLDLTPEQASTLAQEAARKGYLEYRFGGDVVEVGFRHLLRPLERQT